jgi:GxxExxY protein
VHNNLGPGLEERFYRDALLYKLDLRGITTEKETSFAVSYKGKHIGGHRIDIIVADKVLVELKAVRGKLLEIHIAQTLSELNVSGLPVALLVNFVGKSVQVRRFEKRSFDGKTNGNIPQSSPSCAWRNPRSES